jgi:hypothetical protein
MSSRQTLMTGNINDVYDLIYSSATQDGLDLATLLSHASIQAADAQVPGCVRILNFIPRDWMYARVSAIDGDDDVREIHNLANSFRNPLATLAPRITVSKQQRSIFLE